MFSRPERHRISKYSRAGVEHSRLLTTSINWAEKDFRAVCWNRELGPGRSPTFPRLSKKYRGWVNLTLWTQPGPASPLDSVFLCGHHGQITFPCVTFLTSKMSMCLFPQLIGKITQDVRVWYRGGSQQVCWNVNSGATPPALPHTALTALGKLTSLCLSFLTWKSK